MTIRPGKYISPRVLNRAYSRRSPRTETEEIQINLNKCLDRKGQLHYSEAREKLSSGSMDGLALLIDALSNTAKFLPGDKSSRMRSLSSYREAKELLLSELGDILYIAKEAYEITDPWAIQQEDLKRVFAALGIKESDFDKILQSLEANRASISVFSPNEPSAIILTGKPKKYDYHGCELAELIQVVKDKITSPPPPHTGKPSGVDKDTKPKKDLEVTLLSHVTISIPMHVIPRKTLVDLNSLQSLKIRFPDFEILGFDEQQLPAEDKLAEALREKINELEQHHIVSLVDSIHSFQEGQITIELRADNLPSPQRYRISVSEFNEKIKPLFEKDEIKVVESLPDQIDVLPSTTPPTKPVSPAKKTLGRQRIIYRKSKGIK